MPKTVTVGKDWVLLSDLVPGSNENSIFKGQIQKGSIKIKESLTHPTDSTDSYVMRASDSGGNGDEVFKCGDGKLKVYVIAYLCSSATVSIEDHSSSTQRGGALLSELVEVYEIISESSVNGDHDFEVGSILKSPNIFLDEFRFLDAQGSAIVPTAGTVLVQVSSNGDFWRTLNDGSFAATTDTASESYTPPSGLAAISKLRISLSGVTGANGFKANLVRG